MDVRGFRSRLGLGPAQERALSRGAPGRRYGHPLQGLEPRAGVDFFRKSGTLDEPEIQTETDRYIAWPAQALSYKIGQLKFVELRERVRKELGAKFDIRTFHDEMLNGGVLPLDLLDARTNSWIQAQIGAGKPVAGN